jgi:hypothetical protein
MHCFSGRRKFLKIRTNIQTGILRTDAAAKFFTTKILIVDFKSIKQKTVETEKGIFKRLFENCLF